MITKEATTVKKISLSWIVVSDLAKAKKYFTEVVGLKVSCSSEEFGWVELIGQDGGAILGLAQANEKNSMPAGQNAIVCFTVDDIEKAKAEMAKKGAKFLGDILEVPGIVKLQSFLDADGNNFQLAQNLEHNDKI
jgi:predicted enzyme related to lactoylglutathione lyase